MIKVKFLEIKCKIYNLSNFYLQTQNFPAYYKDDIDGTITINDHRTTCLDFGGYIRVQERGKTDVKELKSSLCYKSLKELTVSNDIILKAKKFDVLSGRREIVVSEAVVAIMVQKSDGVAFPITLKALVS